MYSILNQIIENVLLVFKHQGKTITFEELHFDVKKQVCTDALESYQLRTWRNEREIIVQVGTLEK